MEEQRTISFVSTDIDLTDTARPIIEDKVNTILAGVKLECPDGDCGAQVDTFFKEVPEAGLEVLAMGVICTKGREPCWCQPHRCSI